MASENHLAVECSFAIDIHNINPFIAQIAIESVREIYAFSINVKNTHLSQVDCCKPVKVLSRNAGKDTFIALCDVVIADS